MRQIAPIPVLAVALCLALTPAAAQEAEEERGLSLMERGLSLFFDGLRQEAEPALTELQRLMEEFEPAMRAFADEMGPALRELMAEVEDWSSYHPPEMLDNGDIIIRKKTPEEMEPQFEDGGGVEL
ncbi:hypothetical protein SAMN05421759_103291 [Roseivivax lentus]|uniref:AAA+ family ATPase n=1 Tax=Roseivivax lentus TaxID=633194 RepID=A0A1N7LYY6_9RHOB|nr:hypothetical protein [Roseivivax lentus]SIS79022.1 hypothetical protein SAMN05421759_103291 [Roseivivax lentus]